MNFVWLSRSLLCAHSLMMCLAILEMRNIANWTVWINDTHELSIWIILSGRSDQHELSASAACVVFKNILILCGMDLALPTMPYVLCTLCIHIVTDSRVTVREVRTVIFPYSWGKKIFVLAQNQYWGTGDAVKMHQGFKWRNVIHGTKYLVILKSIPFEVDGNFKLNSQVSTIINKDVR